LRSTRRISSGNSSFNPFFSFRNHLNSQNRPNSHVNLNVSTNDDIVNQSSFYLNNYINEQLNENMVNDALVEETQDDDNDDDDDDDDDEQDNALISSTDSSSSSQIDLDWDVHNPIASDLNEEDENSILLTDSDTNEEDEEIGNQIFFDDDDDDDSDEDENAENSCFKRRRLNSIGKYKLTNGIKYNKPVKVTKCKQSKRIRALAFNLKRNEIAAISMNAAFHYFDIKRFEQVN
jgi:hypothetical protein